LSSPRSGRYTNCDIPDPINNNSIQFNSIQFNGYLLTCRLSSTSANYKASTNKTQNSTNTQDKTLNKQNKYEVKQYKRSTGAESNTLTEHR
jgi:hypothetical protein